ncbi:carboxylate-amine ligase [Streptacidiphilus neutrinimicus]|uniref:carboxylate-amine ligase n=1 Tax=Streptacidiphilus neutrinimicus TaxID=105420 RepID=UPI000AFEB2EA|nr:glutamate--cysteine ligase [Streptacidiphilus neutrinimicus]
MSVENHTAQPVEPRTNGAGLSASGAAPRLGVEEEFLLLDPGSGRPLPRAAQVRRRSRLYPGLGADEVQHELLQAQLEIATPVCTTLPELHGQLSRMRGTLSEAAQDEGCVLAACAASPFPDGAVAVPVTDKPRYRHLHDEAPLLTDEQLINGLHVHVEVRDDGARIEALNRMRPWLPLLVALSASSPLWRGRDTGFASWRHMVNGRWPVAGIPPRFQDPDDYERRTRELVDRGMVADIGQMYWLARASARYPTLEVRACDVQVAAEDAVVLAGLVRAQVMTVLAEAEAGRKAPVAEPEQLDAAVWHAARHGLTGDLHDPHDLRPRPAADVVNDALDRLGPALDRSGDQSIVRPALERMVRDGNGAVVLRRTLAAQGWPAVLPYLRTRTRGSLDHVSRTP